MRRQNNKDDRRIREIVQGYQRTTEEYTDRSPSGEAPSLAVLKKKIKSGTKLLVLLKLQVQKREV